MDEEPASSPGRDEDPAPGVPGLTPYPQGGDIVDGPDDLLRGATPDWMDEAEWKRVCAARSDEDDEEPPLNSMCAGLYGRRSERKRADAAVRAAGSAA